MGHRTSVILPEICQGTCPEKALVREKDYCGWKEGETLKLNIITIVAMVLILGVAISGVVISVVYGQHF